jgi:GPH family glycoside/pentoside/hexuronide:cation symporter
MLLLAGFVPALAKRFGKFNLYVFSIIWFIVFSVIGYFVGYANNSLFMAILFLRSIGFGLTTILMFMFAPDCVEYGTFRTGERAEGVTCSLQTFATKLMNGIAASVWLAWLSLVLLQARALFNLLRRSTVFG